jgi:hypothetical protein
MGRACWLAFADGLVLVGRYDRAHGPLFPHCPTGERAWRHTDDEPMKTAPTHWMYVAVPPHPGPGDDRG